LDVVGNNDPIDAGQYCSVTAPGPGYPSGFDKDLSNCFLAQAFTLTLGAYIDRIKLTLIGNSNQGATPYPFLLAITSDLNACNLARSSIFPPEKCSGPAVRFLRKESVMVFHLPANHFMSFTDSFQPIFLPPGTYYLVIGSPNGVNTSVTGVAASVTWAPNRIGSSQMGTIGASFCSSQVSIDCCIGFIWHLQGLDPNQPDNMFGTNGTFAFGLEGPSEIVRVRFDGPVTPAPGVPVEAHLELLDVNGNFIGRSSRVTIDPSKTQWLDFNLSELVNRIGQRFEEEREAVQAVP
jgi:hypothetical protein